ncbi:uncharacterized protein LOC108487812 [Gossypium arboreum]|uniref:uncharacterized protein LOC108487812 n=1 Tax=Gossypium arboreum TaxID=29729 RepID=UPI0022F18851|nr:uncharacterized protein LOC108487812 [Gossypium arboreum]
MWNPRLTQTNQAARLMLKLDPIDARFMSHKGGNQMGLAIMVRYRLGEPNLKMMKRVRESGMAMAMLHWVWFIKKKAFVFFPFYKNALGQSILIAVIRATNFIVFTLHFSFFLPHRLCHSGKQLAISLHPLCQPSKSFLVIEIYENVFILSYILQNGDDSVDWKLENETMAAFVQTLLQQIQQRFQTMSDSIIMKIDEMGCRIDELEQTINDLKAEMDADKPPSPSVPSLPKDDSKSPKEP